jgi:hypothetical protein
MLVLVLGIHRVMLLQQAVTAGTIPQILLVLRRGGTQRMCAARIGPTLTLLHSNVRVGSAWRPLQ